jgi:predicted ATPase
MQWIDPGSVSLLFHLVRRISGRRILLVGAYRPQDVALHPEGEPHPLLEVVDELQAAFGDIEIDLMESEGDVFVDALIDSEPNELDEGFRALLHRHTAGNPLFIIELLRAMQLRGEIRRSPKGRWVEGPQLNWDELPARVEAVIGRRIGHLSPACQ